MRLVSFCACSFFSSLHKSLSWLKLEIHVLWKALSLNFHFDFPFWLLSPFGKEFQIIWFVHFYQLEISLQNGRNSKKPNIWRIMFPWYISSMLSSLCKLLCNICYLHKSYLSIHASVLPIPLPLSLSLSCFQVISQKFPEIYSIFMFDSWKILNVFKPLSWEVKKIENNSKIQICRGAWSLLVFWACSKFRLYAFK